MIWLIGQLQSFKASAGKATHIFKFGNREWTEYIWILFALYIFNPPKHILIPLHIFLFPDITIPPSVIFCICDIVWSDWPMSFWLEQEGGSLITPMALARPLHPINSRSRNKRRDRWVGRCVSTWWPLFPCRNSELIYILSIRMHYLYEFWLRTYTQGVSFNIGVAAPHHSLWDWFWRVGFLCWMPLNALFGFTNCVLLDDDKTNTMMLVTIGIRFKQLFDTRYLVFCNLSPPRIYFLSLDLLSEYWIHQGTTGPFYVTSGYSPKISYRGVFGIATDCPCSVWCREFTACPLYIGLRLGNLDF